MEFGQASMFEGHLCNVSDQKERKSLEDKYSPVEKAGKFIAG